GMDAEGNAGLININTRRSTQRGYSANIQTGFKKFIYDQSRIYGARDYGALNATADVQYNTEKLSAYGSINVDQSHFLEGFRTDIYFPRQTWMQTDTGNYRYHNVNYMLGADYKLSPRTTLGANYLHEKNNYDGSDHVNNPVRNNGTGLVDSTLRTYATYFPIATSNALNLHSVTTFDTSGSRLTLNADYFRYYRTDRSDFESQVFRANGAVSPNSQTRYFDTNKQDIHVYTFKADVNLHTAFAELAYGGKLSFIDTYSNAFYYRKTSTGQVYDTRLSNEFDYRENTETLYLSGERDLQKWKLQAGLRAELTQTRGYSYTLDQERLFNYLRLFPSVLISYKANEQNAFAFTFGRRINRPTFWNLNPFRSLFTAYSYGEGNPFLQPEYTSNAEVSHTLANKLVSAMFFSVTNNGFSNVTFARASTDTIITSPRNFLKTTRYGLSETFTFKTGNVLESNNQATLYFADARSALPEVRGVSGWGSYLSSSNTVFLNSEKNLALAVNAWYQFPEVYRFGRTIGYYKVDAGFKASAFHSKLDVTLTANDIFKSSALAYVSNINGLKQQFTNFQINRFVLLSLNYHFGNHKSEARKQDSGNADERDRI
ncbi:MAG: TonB-dependent receptor family protein, partial [Mucilaginibacter polytrichastri]|nr:TonB-dependent receptor family protein [Mucilaginibacter polytrichastri]